MTRGSFVRSLIIVLLLIISIGSSPFARAQTSLLSLERTPVKLSDAIPRKPRLALVLSGGGAKGFAHIGVLEILDSAHIPVDLIVGTSIGASIGGLYASGYSPRELERFALETNWEEVFGNEDESHRVERLLNKKDPENAVLSLRFNGFLQPVLPTALSNGQRLTMLINHMVINSPLGVPFDFLTDLRIPFITVATDIVSGTRRIITRGDLTAALRASATLPLRFDPLTRDSAILMDGGLIANVPVDIARDSARAMFTLVSNTTARLRERSQLNTPWDVADQVITLMMRVENERSMERADLVITPEIPAEYADDFSQIAYFIERGKEAARQALPALLTRFQSTLHGIESESIGDTLMPSIRTLHIHSSPPSTDSIAFSPNDFIGKPLIRAHGQSDLERMILTAYRHQGFTLARIDSIVYQPSSSTIDLYVDEGHVANVVMTGQESIHPDLVSREFPISAGEVFRSLEAERGIRNLTGTGYFDFASIEVIRDPHWQGTQYYLSGSQANYTTFAPAFPTVVLSLRVRAANVLRLGVLADNEYGAQFSTELANENVLGTGVETSIKGGLGPLSRYAVVTLDAPRLFTTFATFMLQGYTEYKDISTYSTLPVTPAGKIVSEVTGLVREVRDAGARLRLGGQLGRLGALIAELRTEQQRAYALPSKFYLDPPTVLTALKGELVFDTRDDRDYPHSGSFATTYIESGLKLLGGKLSYSKFYALAEQPVALSGLHTIIPRIQLGFGDLTVPRLEQFALGGIESFYGLNEYELRGRQMVEGSLTYQIAIPHTLFFPTFVSFRYDVGATWLEPSAIKFYALTHGLGAQIGLKTPLGRARFGIGENFRFNEDKKKPIDLNKPRFYFSIGANL